MQENDVVVTTKYGRMPAFAACPDQPGPYPAIVLYMDAPGFREELKNHARRIAKNGYFCILPDMYYRLGTVRFDLPRRGEGMSAVIKAAMNHLSIEDVVDDTAAILQWLDAQEQVKEGPVGCVGHCMSGRYVTAVAARFPHRFAASASLYGVGIVTDEEDSPHRIVDRIRGEIWYGFAETDASVPDHVIPALQQALETAGVKHKLEIFPSSLHGYMFSERPSYCAEASEMAWSRLFDLWERNLK